MNNNTRKIMKVTFYIMSFILIFLVVYLNAESFISYKVISDDDRTIRSEPVSETAISPEALPISKKYVLKLVGEHICVYDNENKLIFKDMSGCISSLSSKDIYELERDGIVYTVRSEIIEILNYLKS